MYWLLLKRELINMPPKFRVAALAGTFDHFHQGHQKFLVAAFDAADTIYIGITSDTFAQSLRQAEVAAFADRKKEVEIFLAKNNLLLRTTIFELNDIHGPTLDEGSSIEAIIVTGKTRYGAELVNKLRREKGLLPLVIVEIAMVEAKDGGELSSSRIRNGEIDRKGDLFIQPLWLRKDLRLPPNLRLSLQKPLGALIFGHENNLNEAIAVAKENLKGKNPVSVVTVGDVVTKSFNENGIPMDIAIVDFYVKRQQKFKSIKDLGFKKEEPDMVVKNAKGTLTGETFRTVQEAFRLTAPSPFVIRIVGEEDLTVLPVVLAAPLKAHVFYGQPRFNRGQPGEGVVDVLVTEEKKTEAREIVSRFVA